MDFFTAYNLMRIKGSVCCIKTPNDKYMPDKVYRYIDPYGAIDFEGRKAHFTSYEIDNQNWIELDNNTLLKQSFIKRM